MRVAKPAISRKAKRLIALVVARTDDYAFVGSMHPDDHDEIERAYNKAIKDLSVYVADLETSTKSSPNT